MYNVRYPDSFGGYIERIYEKLFPKDIEFCDKCKGRFIPYWIFIELDKNVDLDIPYESYRNELLKGLKKNLCENCANDMIGKFDLKYSKKQIVDKVDSDKED